METEGSAYPNMSHLWEMVVILTNNLGQTVVDRHQEHNMATVLTMGLPLLDDRAGVGVPVHQEMEGRLYFILPCSRCSLLLQAR